MKKEDKVIYKLLKDGFSIEEWEQLPSEIKQNDLIVEELLKKIQNISLEAIKTTCNSNPFLIKFLPHKTQIELVNNNTFRYLAEDLQLQILKKNPKMINLADKQVQVKFALKNPLDLSKFIPSVQKEVVKENEYYLGFASKEVQMEEVEKNNNLLHCCSNMIQCMYVKNDPNYYDKCNYEVKRDIISLKNLNPETISLKTLESYLSSHHDSLSLKEINDYKQKLEKTDREDRKQLISYIEYLIVNVDRKRN